jgi:hypothetical protein
MKRLLRFRFSDLPPVWWGWISVGAVVLLVAVIVFMYVDAGCLDTHCH